MTVKEKIRWAKVWLVASIAGSILYFFFLVDILKSDFADLFAPQGLLVAFVSLFPLFCLIIGALAVLANIEFAFRYLCQLKEIEKNEADTSIVFLKKSKLEEWAEKERVKINQSSKKR